MEDKRRIFNAILPEEEFIDRRIHKSEYLDPESDSDNDDYDFADKYDTNGRKLQSNLSMKSETLMNKSQRDKFLLSPNHSSKKSFPNSPMTLLGTKSAAALIQSST